MNERAKKILEETDALLTGHFLLTSGRHSNQYMQCARAFQYPDKAEELLQPVAEAFKNDNVNLVLSPALGAVTIGYELAKQLGARSFFTERVDEKMVLRRTQELTKDMRVVVAEDVITTGGTVKELIELVKASPATLVGVALVVDRSGGKDLGFGVKTVAAYTTNVASYLPEECPQCKEGIPLEAPGTRSSQKL